MHVDPVEQRAGDLGLVVGGAARGAAAGEGGVAEMAAAAEEKAEEAEGVFGSSSNGALLPDAASLLAEVDDYLGARRFFFNFARAIGDRHRQPFCLRLSCICSF